MPENSLGPNSYFIRKFLKCGREELMKHDEHNLRVDHGTSSLMGSRHKSETYTIGLWCNDCQEEVGSPVEISRRVEI